METMWAHWGLKKLSEVGNNHWKKMEENLAFRESSTAGRSGYGMVNLEFLTQKYRVGDNFISKLTYSLSI